MSWNGPVAGAAPYPPQSYTNSQPGYGQQQSYQHGQQPNYGQYPPGATYPPPGPPQRPPSFQPPKKKGNPIITRYPPPPGYRGPAQHQGPFGANQYPNQYPPSQTGFAQTAPIPPAYPNQGYAAPPTPQGYSPQGYGPPHPPAYPPRPFAHAQNYQWPQTGHQPSQTYPQAQSHQAGPGYAPQASTYPGYPPQPVPGDSNSQLHGQTPGWPSANGQAQYPPNHQYNAYSGPAQTVSHGFDPNATPTPTTAHMAIAQASQIMSQSASAPEESNSVDKPQLFLAWDDWDFDFEGAIWPKSNEPVDPNLSLGVIIWHPAKQVTRALPCTFDEAEDQALKPAPEKLDNGESVSVYFMAENSHEAFLDVRQTDEWDNIRDDPIFVVFTDEDMQRNLVSLEDCIAQRDRPDEALTSIQEDDDEEMPDASWSVMDHLEQVLSTGRGTSLPSAVERQETSPTQSSQEDILAQLGVTGAPKPPSDGPQPSLYETTYVSPVSVNEKHASSAISSLPSSSHLPSQRAPSYGDGGNNHAPIRSYGSLSSGSGYHNSIPPPPPPPPGSQRYGSWNQLQPKSQGFAGSRGSPAPSEGSNHTMAGSDFEPEKPSSNVADDATLPGLSRSDSSFSRKRSYEDADHSDEKPRQQDDYTKRKRRSQVDAAYSRR